MKKLIIIYLLLGILFTQELQVEGNLNVTGTIESVTIDSLNQVILDLQNQIAGMQVENRLETRIFTTGNIVLILPHEFYPIDVQAIIGSEIDNALIEVLAVDMDGENAVVIDLSDRIFDTNSILIRRLNQEINPISIENDIPVLYSKEVFENYGNYISIRRDGDEQINITLTLAITAQFPN
jgi:hypothetical protein